MIEENYWNELLVKLAGPSTQAQHTPQQEAGEITEERQQPQPKQSELLNLDTNVDHPCEISNGKIEAASIGQDFLYQNYVIDSEIPSSPIYARKINIELQTANGSQERALPRRSFAANKHFIVIQNVDKEIEVLNAIDFSIRTKLETPKEDLSDICLYTKPPHTFVCLAYPSGIYAFIIELAIDSQKIFSKCLLQFPIMQTLQTTEMKVEWKNENRFALISNKDVTLFSIASSEQMIPEEKETKNMSPAQFFVFTQEKKIIDFAFSQKNHLLFLCLESGVIKVINSDNGSKLREFLPYQQPEQCKRILLFRNLLPTDPTKGPLAFAPGGDYTLKDIFITLSETGHIKVWDLGEWDNSAQSYYCIESNSPQENGQTKESLRFAVFDFSKSFLFVVRGNEEKYQSVLTYHVNPDFYRWTEQYKEMKKQKKFFDYVGEFRLPNTQELNDIVVLNINQNDRLALNFIEGEEEMNLMQKCDPYKEEYCDARTALEVLYLTKSGLGMAVIHCRKVYPAFETMDPDFYTIEGLIGGKSSAQQLSAGDVEKIGEPGNLQGNAIEAEKSEEEGMVIENSEPLGSKAMGLTKPKESPAARGQGDQKLLSNETKNVSGDNEGRNKTPRRKKRFTDYVDYPKSEGENPIGKNDKNAPELGELVFDSQQKKHKPTILRTSPPNKSKAKQESQATQNETKQDSTLAATNNPLKLKFASKKPFQKPSNPVKADSAQTQIAQQLNENNSVYDNPPSNSARLDSSKVSAEKREEEDKTQENATRPRQVGALPNQLAPPLARDLSIESVLDNKLKTFTDDFMKYFDNKFSKMEQIIENKIEERMNKMQVNLTQGTGNLQLDSQLTTMFSKAFEFQVTPSMEKYLTKLFEQINANFEKGQKFYMDKLMMEQSKAAQIRDTMNELLKSFLQISNTLTETAASNQTAFSKLEVVFQEKKGQILKAVDQISGMMAKQEELQRRLENTERAMFESVSRLRDEIRGQIQLVEPRRLEEGKSGRPEIGSKPHDGPKEGKPEPPQPLETSKPQQQQQAGIEPRQTDKFQGVQTINPGVFQPQNYPPTNYNQPNQSPQDFPSQHPLNQGPGQPQPYQMPPNYMQPNIHMYPSHGQQMQGRGPETQTPKSGLEDNQMKSFVDMFITQLQKMNTTPPPWQQNDQMNPNAIPMQQPHVQKQFPDAQIAPKKDEKELQGNLGNQGQYMPSSYQPSMQSPSGGQTPSKTNQMPGANNPNYPPDFKPKSDEKMLNKEPTGGVQQFPPNYGYGGMKPMNPPQNNPNWQPEHYGPPGGYYQPPKTFPMSKHISGGKPEGGNMGYMGGGGGDNQRKHQNYQSNNPRPMPRNKYQDRDRKGAP